MNLRFLQHLLLACVMGLWSLMAAAQSYPDKPIRILVGFAAGGPTDIVARMFGERLSQKLKQPVVIDNISGANGDLAARQLLSRPADGYTLMWAPTSQLVYGPVMQKTPKFEPLRDYAMIAISSVSHYIAASSINLPVKNMKGFVEYAKKNPGTLSFSSGGTGAANHLAGEWLNVIAGTDLRHIPYKGDAAAAVDLVSGIVTIGFISPNVALPLVKSGRLKALAVTSSSRQEFIADIPTMRESGLNEFTLELFNGLVGRSGTSTEIVNRLNAVMNEILLEPEIRTKLAAIGLNPMSMSSEQFRSLVQQQGQHWQNVIRKAGIPQE